MSKFPEWTVAALALLAGCSLTPDKGSTPTVFVTGNVQTSSSDYGLTKPTYWKDGKLTVLDTGTYANGEATGWTSPDNGTTMYIAGNVRTGSSGTKVPVYWKNGVLNTLTIPGTATADAQADGITRDTQGHIYINGYIKSSTTSSYLPGYWKDGTWQNLSLDLPSPYTGNPQTIGYAFDKVAIDANNHVYVSGYIRDNVGGKNVPVYWQDNVVNVVSLSSISSYTNGGEVQGTMLTSSSSGSPVLSSFTVLVRAYDSNFSPLPAYIQGSGSLTQITTNSLSSAATNGAVWWLTQSPSGDLYATGEIGQSSNFWTQPSQPPVYWKNWSLVQLPGISGQPYGQTGGAWFSGGDVYINGTTYSSTVSGLSSPVYWVNGQVHQLPLSTSNTTYVGGYTYDLALLN